jgi:hypothetical protein
MSDVEAPATSEFLDGSFEVDEGGPLEGDADGLQAVVGGGDHSGRPVRRRRWGAGWRAGGGRGWEGGRRRQIEISHRRGFECLQRFVAEADVVCNGVSHDEEEKGKIESVRIALVVMGVMCV